MVKLRDIFNMWYGVNLEVVNSTVVEKGIPFVSRQSVNNGVVCYVSPIEGVKPNPANTLSIAVSGSVLSTFYHDYEYYSGRDVYIAEPKEPMAKEEMLYYAYIIELNRYRYNYGRGANRTFKDILVPNRNEIPSYIKEIITPSIKNEVINTKHLIINTENWKWFDLKDLFTKTRGKRLTVPNRIDGKIPLVTAGEAGTGVAAYISNEVDTYHNAITIDMFGYSCYREYEFACDDNILVLQNSHVNRYNGLFIASIINMDRYRCAYGRQYRQKTFDIHKIKLPITSTGEPDWQYMEDYIKSLPYSKNLEPIDPKEQIRALKNKLALREQQLKAQQTPSNLVNYGTVNIYEK